MKNTQDFLNALKSINTGMKENSQDMAVFLGKITSINPIVVRINPKFILDEDFLIVTNNIKRREIVLHNGEKVVVNEGIDIGDTVIMLRQQGGQKFVLVDKI